MGLNDQRERAEMIVDSLLVDGLIEETEGMLRLAL
jgi:hypothetical protein